MAADKEEVMYKWTGKEGQGFYAGVPARDLTADDWKVLNKVQRAEVKSGILYKAVEAQATSDEPAPTKAEPKATPPTAPAPATVAEAPTKKEG